VNALLRETGREIAGDEAESLQKLHAVAYAKLASTVRPLPGAERLLEHLSEKQVPYAIATSGRPESAALALKALNVPPEIPVVTRDQARYAKPDPDLFLAAAARLGGVGLLSGGYGQEELERAGAFRVYQDPLDLLTHLDELGIRRAD
jgi:beta-phosphoglucomutase-like phosphatase (HAD superfamily)